MAENDKFFGLCALIIFIINQLISLIIGKISINLYPKDDYLCGNPYKPSNESLSFILQDYLQMLFVYFLIMLIHNIIGILAISCGYRPDKKKLSANKNFQLFWIILEIIFGFIGIAILANTYQCLIDAPFLHIAGIVNVIGLFIDFLIKTTIIIGDNKQKN